MKNLDYKPWELYPQFWKTEAQFWTFLRGCIRRGIWEKSPIKIDFKNKNCSPPPEDYTGRAKSGAYCYLSNVWANKSSLEVDHIEGNVSLSCWEDVLPFIQHMVPPPDNMALVTKEAHKIKSYAEKQGITFEEARVQKQAIQIQKGDDKAWITDKGFTPASNAKKRREQIVQILLDNS